MFKFLAIVCGICSILYFNYHSGNAPWFNFISKLIALQPRQPGQSNPSNFNHVALFVETWGVSYCLVKNLEHLRPEDITEQIVDAKCKITDPPTWSIHGLWSLNDHDNCNGTLLYNAGIDSMKVNLTETYTKMRWYWRPQGRATENELWIHEWKMHGKCLQENRTLSITTYQEYFQLAVNLHEELALDETINSSLCRTRGVISGENLIESADFLDCLQTSPFFRGLNGTAIQLKYDYHKKYGKKPILVEVIVCLHLDDNNRVSPAACHNPINSTRFHYPNKITWR